MGTVHVESVCTDHPWVKQHGYDEHTEVTIQCEACRAKYRWEEGTEEVLVGPDGFRRVLYKHEPAKPHDPELMSRLLNGGS
jgi:hypothetical protein